MHGISFAPCIGYVLARLFQSSYDPATAREAGSDLSRWLADQAAVANMIIDSSGVDSLPNAFLEGLQDAVNLCRRRGGKIVAVAPKGGGAVSVLRQNPFVEVFESQHQALSHLGLAV